MVKDLHLFARKLLLRVLHDRDHAEKAYTLMNDERFKSYRIQDFKNFKALMQLLEESRMAEQLEVSESEDSEISNEPSLSPKEKVDFDTSNYKPKISTFPLLHLHIQIATFVNQVTSDINSLPVSSSRTDYLNWNQRRAIEELLKMEYLIIKPSDERGNVVLKATSHYKRMCLDLLNNQTLYCKIDQAKTESFVNDFRNILRVLNDGIISKNVMEFLTVEFPATTTFYALPKIHKNDLKPSNSVGD